MKASDVQNVLSRHQFTNKRVEAIGTRLREEGLLPRGGRGLHAPNLTAEQTVVFTLAVAGAERQADAVAIAMRSASLTDGYGRTLLDELTKAISAPDLAANIRHVRVIVDLEGPAMAELTRADGTLARFFEPPMWEVDGFDPDAQGSSYVGRIGHIGGGALDMLALKMQQSA